MSHDRDTLLALEAECDRLRAELQDCRRRIWNASPPDLQEALLKDTGGDEEAAISFISWRPLKCDHILPLEWDNPANRELAQGVLNQAWWRSGLLYKEVTEDPGFKFPERKAPLASFPNPFKMVRP
jgi:hypothetical protein